LPPGCAIVFFGGGVAYGGVASPRSGPKPSAGTLDFDGLLLLLRAEAPQARLLLLRVLGGFDDFCHPFFARVDRSVLVGCCRVAASRGEGSFFG
jgi:hypothetical protein